MLESLCAWLEKTPLSAGVQNVGWIIPASQIVHILCLAAVLFSALSIDLRVLGVGARRTSLDGMAAHFLPWIWTAVPLMAVTGAILIIGEPRRDLLNPVFQTKMLLLICALAATLGIQSIVRRAAADRPGWPLRALAVGSLAFWFGIAVCGRLIAYAT
ncbi:MAG TPA: DUF6644 family protein [Phenylobacterium sp.]|jgi:hypothetical protein|uniref:DUF6644 family protein n=1 Tax=Phenylobacterium sp. TaxID=1871053 RepID=UPI002CF22EB7|nr:DUF6644 family protein [Phenylobacterium sp.]HXA40553.1 DUF6644 family protein [Phenylobacterium sp.]